MGQLKVFLGDLVHTWEKVSVWTIPVNIALIGGFIRQELGNDIDIRLFKDPDKMIEAVRAEKPDVVGFSYYVWNLNLNKLLAGIARECNPNVLVMGGGPQFTNLNYNTSFTRDFFQEHSDLDAFVLNQGERPTAELLANFLRCDKDIAKLRTQSVDGCLINDLGTAGVVRISDPIPEFDDLDQIPSPYLSGMLDEFFSGPFLPIIETNRSCPYRCAYCAWGIGSKQLSQFSLDRVFSEIDYIASRAIDYGTMMICDANFGILERDVEIAEKIYQAHERHGFPKFVNVQWNKSNPERIYRVAKAFGGLASLGASRQSLHEPTLEAIGRKNLPLVEVTSILKKLKVPLFTELILGLPHETKQTHLDANRELMDWGYEINNYNLHMLPGTRMASDEYREKFIRQLGWRLHDNAWGIYDEQIVMEGQEVVLETSTMSKDDLRSFRFLHFLFQFMWGKEWYKFFLIFMKNCGLHPVDFMERVGTESMHDDGVVGQLRKRFAEDHNLENFSTFEELRDYWSEEAHFERLRSGDYGKLNMQYTYEVLLDWHAEFNAMLFSIAEDHLRRSVSDEEDVAPLLRTCQDVLKYQAAMRFELTESLALVESKVLTFTHDILGWIESGCNDLPSELAEGHTLSYEFYLTEEQRDLLQGRLKQFQTGDNVNMALRKLSEYLAPKYMLFSVRKYEMEKCND